MHAEVVETRWCGTGWHRTEAQVGLISQTERHLLHAFLRVGAAFSETDLTGFVGNSG